MLALKFIYKRDFFNNKFWLKYYSPFLTGSVKIMAAGLPDYLIPESTEKGAPAQLSSVVVVEMLRHQKRVKAALLPTSKYSFAIDSPW